MKTLSKMLDARVLLALAVLASPRCSTIYEPVARITGPDCIVVGQVLELDASSSEGGLYPISKYHWTWKQPGQDDAVFDGDTHEASTVPASGRVEVTLQVEDTAGGTNTTSKTVLALAEGGVCPASSSSGSGTASGDSSSSMGQSSSDASSSLGGSSGPSGTDSSGAQASGSQGVPSSGGAATSASQGSSGLPVQVSSSGLPGSSSEAAAQSSSGQQPSSSAVDASSSSGVTP